MNRAERRRAARIKHRLVELRKIPPGHPLAAIQLAEGQKAWTCSCNGGWLSVSNESPDESFAAHVESEKTKLAERAAPFVKTVEVEQFSTQRKTVKTFSGADHGY